MTTLVEKKQEIQETKGEKKLLEERMQKLEKEKKKLEEEKKKLEEEKKKLEDQIQKLEDQIQKLEEDLAKEQSQTEQNAQTIIWIQSLLTRLSQKVTRLSQKETQLSQKETQLSQIQTQLSQIQTQLSEKEKQLTSLQVTLQDEPPAKKPKLEDEQVRKALDQLVVLPKGDAKDVDFDTQGEQLIARKEGITIFGLGTENYSEILLQIPCTKKAWCDVYLFLKSALNEEIAASTTTLFIQSLFIQSVTFAKYDVETIDTELSAGLYVLHSSIHARWTVAVKNHIPICQSLSNSEKSTPCPTPKKSTSSSRFPKCIAANYDKCVICNYSRTSILESAHIVDFSRFNNRTCSDEVNCLLHTLGVDCMKNGIRLCPTCHSLFGNGEISLVDLSSDGIKMCVVLCIEEEDDPAIKLMYHLVKASIALDDVADSINPHPMLVKFHLQNSIAKFLRPAVPTSLKGEADVSDDELSDDDHHTAVQALRIKQLCEHHEEALKKIEAYRKEQEESSSTSDSFNLESENDIEEGKTHGIITY